MHSETMNLLGIGKYLISGNFNVWVTFRPPPPPYVKELFLHGVDIYLKSPNIFSFKGRQIAFIFTVEKPRDSPPSKLWKTARVS